MVEKKSTQHFKQMKYGNARKKSKWTINSAVNDRIIDVFCSFLLTYVFMIFYSRHTFPG